MPNKNSNHTYKILFTDIDGTLLNKKREVSDATKKEIKRISEELNVPIVLVSSRMPKAMTHIQDELNITDPLICHNGSLIIENINGEHKQIFSEMIRYEIVGDLYKNARKFGIHASLYRNDDWFVEEMDYWAERESNNTKVRPELKSFDEMFAEENPAQLNMHKIMCMGEKENIDLMHEFLNENYSAQLNFYRSKDTYLEISSSKSSKAVAVKFLHEKIGLSSKEIIAIGDSYNDYDMLKLAGLGIAMGNSVELIKEAADDITLPNYEDGLAAAIKKYF
jgi:Cof subfamily protein (haloacid dehalogenase superfamily)